MVCCCCHTRGYLGIPAMTVWENNLRAVKELPVEGGVQVVSSTQRRVYDLIRRNAIAGKDDKRTLV
jgi:hypothetical protein